MIWIWSDLHFCHNKPFIYETRGYPNIESMNKDLIDKWNSKINKNDTIYLLGDLMLNDTDEGMRCFNQLKGNIHIIAGNHDSNTRIARYKESPHVCEVSFGDRLKYKHWTFLLTHYPVITENYQERHKVISLCGHSHTTDPFIHWEMGTIYHCEVDAQPFPITLDQIYDNIKEKIASC